MGHVITEEYAIQIERDGETGRVLKETHRLGDILHRDGQPAIRLFDPQSGALIGEEWYNRGIQSREDGPAVTHFDPATGVIRFQAWITQHGVHRQGGLPAKINRDPKTGAVILEECFEFNKRHNAVGPAYIVRDEHTGVVTLEEWYQYDVATRAGGLPAKLERDEKTGHVIVEEYWVDGRPFRADGPCFVSRDPASGTITGEEFHDKLDTNAPTVQPSAKRDWSP